MTLISVDLTDSQQTIKTKRILIGFNVNAEEEVVFVQYRETRFTGTYQGKDYVLISEEDMIYKSDYSTWFDSDAGQAIKAAIEASLAQPDPNS